MDKIQVIFEQLQKRDEKIETMYAYTWMRLLAIGGRECTVRQRERRIEKDRERRCVCLSVDGQVRMDN